MPRDWHSWLKFYKSACLRAAKLFRSKLPNQPNAKNLVNRLEFKQWQSITFWKYSNQGKTTFNILWRAKFYKKRMGMNFRDKEMLSSMDEWLWALNRVARVSWDESIKIDHLLELLVGAANRVSTSVNKAVVLVVIQHFNPEAILRHAV